MFYAWLEKVGSWGTWFPGNLVIWREIYEFETKKYIRNVGKCCTLGGKFYHVPGKSNISSHSFMLPIEHYWWCSVFLNFILWTYLHLLQHVAEIACVCKVGKNIIFHNKTFIQAMFYRQTFWYQFCNFKHFLKAQNSEDSLASSCEEFCFCNPVWDCMGYYWCPQKKLALYT